ncbi:MULTISPECIES: SOS response-associated peptidase family protein [Lactobacillus]|uniref:Abasic site processing protein n=1 Tax=Lactobacillus xujianguonis TaxID=2495899 RepID=A0A437STY0_9LACO|nr:MULTISPECIES: SOS response-associated peptidase family protein [Lactobacillus]RVU70365.1 DUF159 family protein [Lactobacillus xujianguonis]RVU73472.1 DUF159 family protein [Lactobacillus xujianguonis]
MCNQFRVPSLSEIAQYLKKDLVLPLVEPNFTSEAQDIYPKSVAPVLLYQDGKLQLVQKSWGYPSPVDQNKPVFNARIERFYEQKTSMWDKSFARQRCLIIAQEFFESSKQTYKTNNDRTYHDRYSFSNPEQPLTLIAGIYDQDYFSMVTTQPNSDMQAIHNRMPLVIQPSELRQWLFQNFTSLIDRSNFSLTVTKQARKN